MSSTSSSGSTSGTSSKSNTSTSHSSSSEEIQDVPQTPTVEVPKKEVAEPQEIKKQPKKEEKKEQPKEKPKKEQPKKEKPKKEKKGKKHTEIELESEGSPKSSEDGEQSSDDERLYEVEELTKYEPKGGFNLHKFFHILFFRSSWKQILKGRKRNLRISDLGEVPRSLHIESYNERLSAAWAAERAKGKSALFKILFKMDWKAFVLSFITGAIYEVFSLAYPLMASFIVKWLNNPDAKIGGGILFIVLALIFQIIVCFSQEFSRKWIFQIAFRFRNGLISLIYDKALKLNSAGIEQPGRLVNLMSNDASVFLGHLEYTILGMACPLMLIILFVLIFNNMGGIAWVSLVGMIVFIFINVAFSFINGQLFKYFTQKKDKRITLFNEILRNIKFIKYNRWEKPMTKSLTKRRWYEEIWLCILGVFRGCFYTTSIEIGPSLSILLFGVMVNKGLELKLENVVTTISLFNSIRVPIRTVGIAASSISAMNISIKRITNFLLTPELEPMPVKTTESANAIEMTNVEYKFPNGDIAFQCEDLKIKKGELVCVLGSVGSGKSSFLLSTLNELEKTKGETVLNGKITYSSQSSWLMNATVRDNICFLQPYNREKYNRCIKDACLTADLEGLAGGDQYVVAEKGANLSGGQRQRIALARSLYNAQDIMLLDDPLSAVDFKVGSYIFENAINKNLKGKTRIVVTNQTYFLEKADKIMVLENNKMVYFGSMRQLKKSNLSASQFVRTITGTKVKQEDAVENVVSGDAMNTHTKEERKEKGRVGINIYWEYVKCGLVLPLFIFLFFLVARITHLWYYNYYMTAWGKSILPQFRLPTGKKEFFDSFVKQFGIDMALVWCTEMSLIALCIIASHNIHKKIFGKLMSTTLQYFDQTPMGRILNCFSRDAQQVDYGLPYFVEPLIVNISTIVVTSIAMIRTSEYLSIFVAIFLVIFVVIYWFIVTPVIEMQRLEGVTRSPIFSHFDQTLLGLATIRTASGQHHFKNQLISKVRNNTMSFYTCKMAKLWFLQRMDWIGAAITIIATIFMVITKFTSVVDPAIAGNALTNITNIPTTFTIFGTALIEAESMMQSTERILQLRKLKEEENEFVRQSYRKIPESWPSTGKIVLKDFKFRYRKDLPMVLKGVNAKIENNEKIGVVGRTGSGKSTLMAGLFRIANPATGQVIIDGIDTTNIPLDILRSRMCILPQEATMFTGTIRSNLDPFGEKKDEDMLRVLELVGSQYKLDDKVLEAGENLSMGERQLICLARALLKGSKILIMDEATANIDIQTDQAIQQMVRENFTDCTVITVAHRLQTIMDSDKVMVFDGGYLKENDKPLKLIEKRDTIFNSLVQQSGCAEELERLAREGFKKETKEEEKKEEKPVTEKKAERKRQSKKPAQEKPKKKEQKKAPKSDESEETTSEETTSSSE